MSDVVEKLIICIPAYNEEKNISNVVQKCKEYSHRVVVYDDGSTDKTHDAAISAGAVVIRSPVNMGYGFALKSLFRYAKDMDADAMITIDADGQHDPSQIPSVAIPVMKEGVDIVIGSRFLTQKDRDKVPRYRGFGIKTITRLTHVMSYPTLTDAQSGFRGYSKYALANINLSENGMAVSTEILLKGSEHNLIIKEVPITINYNVGRSSTNNPIAQGIGILNSIIRFMSLRHPLSFYGLSGIILLAIATFHMSKAMDLYSSTRYISTNMILASVGTAVVGVVLLATGVILYALTALLKGKTQDS